LEGLCCLRADVRNVESAANMEKHK
jgi:hypothetical protein